MSQSKEDGNLLSKLCFCCAGGGDVKETATSKPVPAAVGVEKIKTQAPATDLNVKSTPAVAKPVAMAKIYIIFYSTYGHTYKMAQAVKEGVDSVDGAEGVLYQVAETLSEDILGKMHAAPKPDVPVITAADLKDADGFLFGIPTRFGAMSAQMKAFFDSTGQLWQSGGLVGKPAGIFVTVATQGGGMETTALTTVTQFTHHGMIFVPPGYTFGPSFFELDEIRGGSPWGAGTFAGAMGQRQPTESELENAKHQGKYFAGVAKKLKA